MRIRFLRLLRGTILYLEVLKGNGVWDIKWRLHGIGKKHNYRQIGISDASLLRQNDNI